jgi:hypothetical protein
MAEGHGLRRLQMGHARHDRGGMLLGPVDERGHEVDDLGIQPVDAIAHPELEVRRHLVVARARRVQAAGGLAGDLLEPRLDIGMDILERRLERERPGLDLLQDAVEAGLDGRAVGLTDDALAHEHGRMRLRRRDVLGVEAAVEADGGVDLLHGGGRACGKSPAPHAVHAGGRRGYG